MEIEVDADVKAVAEFMQGSIPAARLVAVASAIAALAPILWRQHEAQDVTAVRLVPSPLSGDRGLRLPPTSTELCLAMAGVGDGSGAEES